MEVSLLSAQRRGACRVVLVLVFLAVVQVSMAGPGAVALGPWLRAAVTVTARSPSLARRQAAAEAPGRPGSESVRRGRAFKVAAACRPRGADGPGPGEH